MKITIRSIFCFALAAVFAAPALAAGQKLQRTSKPSKLANAKAPPAGFKFEDLPANPPEWLAGYALRFPLRVVGSPKDQPGKSVMARLPAGCWLRKDGSDVAVQSVAGKMLPVKVLSHDPKGDTLIQFPRSSDDKWYWAYAGNPAAPPAPPALDMQEGLVAEYRQWQGDQIDTWASVVDGLKKSDNVIGNFPLAEIVSNSNPFRPHDPTNFATSYRGYLNIKTAGAYRFLVNAQDAAFLFIDGLKVFERGGQNERLTGRIPISKNGALIDLTAGVHSFEIHHVIGNNPASFGFCVFLWVPPGGTQWAYVPPEAFSQPLHTTVADVEEFEGGQIATFAAGVDDILTTVGNTLYLVRFEAQGTLTDPAKLTWDFGDGTTATGSSVYHLYFKEGAFEVKLQSGKLPPARRMVCAWGAPVNSSPLSLARAMKAIVGSDWSKLDPPRLKELFGFLLVCEQPDRWPLVEAVARKLLTSPDADPQFRATAYVALIDAMARQGNGEKALAQAESALKEFAKVPSLQVRIKLAAADVQFRQLRQIEPAAKAYRAILDEHHRLEIPEVRLAAIRLGDLYAEAGDVPKAGESYRLAGTLGGADFEGTAQTDAITRGAMLRVAEQKLRSGDVRQTRQLMEKIEVSYPEQKLEGLYRFLRAEADRAAGRYDEAIDNYQFLMKLPQWAGYRAKALYGIADSYVRAGEDQKSLKWLETLEESFPKFYDDQKVADYRRTIEARIARSPSTQPAAGGDGRRKSAGFEGLSISFEPDDPATVDQLVSCALIPGMGMGGAYVGLIESIPNNKTYTDGAVRLRNITSGGWIWVEVWYRESLNTFVANSHMHVWIYGAGTDLDPQKGQGTNYYQRSYGQWRKLGFLVRAPLTQDGRIVFSIRQVIGATEIDAMQITPVSDRQYDAMLMFAQKAAAP